MTWSGRPSSTKTFWGAVPLQVSRARVLSKRAGAPDAEQRGEREHDHASSVIYFKVVGLRGTYAALKEKGVAFVDQPHVYIAPRRTSSG